MLGQQIPIAVARWSPRRFMGQQQATLKVTVARAPASGVPVEVFFLDDTSTTATTGADGSASIPYGPDKYGRAMVRITPPANFEAAPADVMETDLQAGGALVSFSLSEKPAASPAVGILAVLALLGLATFGFGNGR